MVRVSQLMNKFCLYFRNDICKVYTFYSQRFNLLNYSAMFCICLNYVKLLAEDNRKKDRNMYEYWLIVCENIYNLNKPCILVLVMNNLYSAFAIQIKSLIIIIIIIIILLRFPLLPGTPFLLSFVLLILLLYFWHSVVRTLWYICVIRTKTT
jgi:hypothetical protein